MLRPVAYTTSITPFSYENGVECLPFWVGVSTENDRKRRHLKTLFKVESFESGDI